MTAFNNLFELTSRMQCLTYAFPPKVEVKKEQQGERVLS